MKISIPKKPSSVDPVETKARSLLKQIATERAKIDAIRRANAAVFEEIDEASSAEKALVEALKAVLKPTLAKHAKATSLMTESGLTVRLRVSTIFDANKLAKKHPAILKSGAIKFSITRDEVDRLIAAGVLTKADAEEVATTQQAVLIDRDSGAEFKGE